jgi:hypothetical protein
MYFYNQAFLKCRITNESVSFDIAYVKNAFAVSEGKKHSVVHTVAFIFSFMELWIYRRKNITEKVRVLKIAFQRDS